MFTLLIMTTDFKILQYFEYCCIIILKGNYLIYNQTLVVTNIVQLIFDDARATCEADGGRLVEICDTAFNDQLKLLVEGKYWLNSIHIL